MNTPVDSLQREIALDPARSFCVTAPAGSGKTELLSRRVLALLAQVQQPEEILAITFTRKAAAEMRERIVQALRMAQHDEPAEEHKRATWRLARAALTHAQKQAWHLLENPARLSIQTIDGLCSSLTAQMPVLSQFGGQPRVTERAQPLYREAVDSLLLQLETDSAIGESLGALLLHLDNRVERLHELLAGLLACRDQWLPHLGGGIGSDAVRTHLETTLHKARGDALTRLCENMQLYRGEILPLLDFAAVNLAEIKPDHALCKFKSCVDLPGIDSAAVADWQSLSNWLLTQKGEWRKKLTRNEGFPAADGAQKTLNQQRKVAMEALLDTFTHDDALLQSLHDVRYLPAATFSVAQWQILVQLTRVLAQAVAQLRVVFQMRGEVDFTEVSLAAARALGSALNPSELMLRLDQRISHFLIDEFQDTSSTQFRLLERLVEGWREHNESGGAPRTLFIVGDGMQSIYSFREAKVGLFLEAREQGVNQLQLIAAPLTVNFRSTPTIVNWNNRIFSQAFPQLENIARGAVPYENAEAFIRANNSTEAENAAANDSEVAIYGIRNDPQRNAEAQKVVEIVRDVLQRDPKGTIAILVRSRPHLLAIVPALQRADITFRATDIDPLAQRAHVRDLLVLLKALLNPADRIAWLALLRSPLLGLDNCDLHTLVAGIDGACVHTPIGLRLQTLDVRAQLSADAAQRIEQVAAIFNLAQQQRARKPLRIWLEGVWIALGGDLLVPADNMHADIQAALELIENLATEFNIDELEQRLQSLYARPSAAVDARVVLMTIHKSKGLEFDTVIVPALDAGTRSDDKPLLRWSEYLADDGKLGIALAAKAAVGSDDDAIYQWLEYEHKQQKQLEDTRLLYVAATRAIKRLYLLFRTRDQQEFKSPPSNSLLSRIWPTIKDEVNWTEARAPRVDATTDSVEKLQRVPPRWRFDAKQTEVSHIAINPPQVLVHSLEAQIGSGLHRMLELFAKFGLVHWDAYSLTQRATVVTQVLQQSGIAGSAIEVASEQVLQAIATMLADTRGRWLLSREHDDAVAEWELIAADKRYVIDRSFVDADGWRWIVDYKNSAPHVHESLEAFSQRELDSYRGQLQIYRDLVSALDKRPLRAALYFPRIAHWLELE